MNVFSDRSSAVPYDHSRPLILVASSEDAARRARVSIDRLNIRIGAIVEVTAAQERLAKQATTGAVWIEVDEGLDNTLMELLRYLRYDTAERRYGAVVSTNHGMFQEIDSCLSGSDVMIVVDADEVVRESALTQTVKRRRNSPERIADVARDREANEVRLLTEQINQIAVKLARLSPTSSPVDVGNEISEISPDRILKVIRARRVRSRYFPEQLFSDPAWDMLLDLSHAQLSQVRVPVSSLCIAAGVPATTALRWLKTMVAEGLVIRRSDPHDARRVFVELTPEAFAAMRNYFIEIDSLSSI